MTSDSDNPPPGRPSRPFPSDDELKAAGWVRVSRRERLITSTPRVGQYFWIDFPHDAYHPEFVDEHPGIVIRAARQIHDTCIVVPLTSRPQDDAKHIHRLAINPNPRGQRDGIVAWAVCDHLYTVHIARLRPILDRYGRAVFPQASQGDLQGVFTAIRSALPRVFPSPPEAGPAPADKPAAVIGPNTLTLPKRPA